MAIRVGLSGHLRQGAVEPLQLFGAQLAVAGAGHHRIQHDQADREVVHGVLDIDRVGGDVGQVGEAFAQLLAPVVIAGDDEQRHRREAAADQAGELGVFRVEAALGQVAGEQDDVGAGGEGGDGAEGALDEHVGFRDAVGGQAARADMQVGELGDQHRGFLGVAGRRGG